MEAPEYLEGIRLFNEGRFWDAHEAWEDLWAPLPRRSDDARFYQGLIQIAAAFLHRERARTRERSRGPALRLSRSALEKLEGLPRVTHGLDLDDLRDRVRACFEPLEDGAAVDTLPPPPKIALTPFSDA